MTESRIREILQAVRAGRSIEVLVLHALAYQQAGKMEQALTSLAKAFESGEPEGYVRTFIDEGPRMEVLLRQAVSRGISIDYASMLLGAIKPSLHHQVQITPGMQSLVEPLTRRELEVLRLVSMGKTNRAIVVEDERFKISGRSCSFNSSNS